jgi:phosphoribosylformylglycinamidine cyclo-ligase
MKLGNIAFQEMCSTFNMGTGYVVIVGKDDEKGVIDLFEKLGERATILGYIEKSNDDQRVRLI